MWSLRIIFICFLVHKANGEVQQNTFINRLLSNTSNCPINACELIKMISENLIKNVVIPHESTRVTSESKPRTVKYSICFSTEFFRFEKWVERSPRNNRRIEKRHQTFTTSSEFGRAADVADWTWWCEYLVAVRPGECVSLHDRYEESQLLESSIEIGARWSNHSSGHGQCVSASLSLIDLRQLIASSVSSDLSSNALTTFHKDTFRGLSNLNVLDLSVNALNYLPAELFLDLENLVKLYVKIKFIHFRCQFVHFIFLGICSETIWTHWMRTHSSICVNSNYSISATIRWPRWPNIYSMRWFIWMSSICSAID